MRDGLAVVSQILSFKYQSLSDQSLLYLSIFIFAYYLLLCLLLKNLILKRLVYYCGRQSGSSRLLSALSRVEMRDHLFLLCARISQM